MSSAHVRPISVDQHPVTRHQYIVPTPSIDALMQKVKRLVRMHTPGAVIFAYPRFGKTYGIRYVKNACRASTLAWCASVAVPRRRKNLPRTAFSPRSSKRRVTLAL